MDTDKSWTIVTAFLNESSCCDILDNSLSNREQINNNKKVLLLPYNMVIYCDPNSYYDIQKIRSSVTYKTQYILENFNDITLQTTFSDYRKQIVAFREKNNDTNHPPASYYLFDMLKYVLLQWTTTHNPFSSTHFAWINSGIEHNGIRNIYSIKESLEQYRDRISLCYVAYKDETETTDRYFFKAGQCTMASGFFTGNKHYMTLFVSDMIVKFHYFLEKEMAHSDEQLISSVYFSQRNNNSDWFEFYYGDYTSIITNYTIIYENVDSIFLHFIKPAFEKKEYKLCLDVCKKMMYGFFTHSCNILPPEMYAEFTEIYVESQTQN